MKYISFFSRYAWLAPFFTFLTGYYLASLFFSPPLITMPSLIGIPIQDAIVILSNNNLNARVLTQKEDDDLPVGTILGQTPYANQRIKAGQSVFLVISKKSVVPQMPSFLHKSPNEISSMLEQSQLITKQYTIECESPANLCIAQHPKPGASGDKINILYICVGQSPIVLLPSLKNRSCSQTVEFFKQYNIPCSIIHAQKIPADHTCKNCMVIDQKPMAGSLINLKQPITIQLYAHI